MTDVATKRNGKGFSQEELARRAGISLRTMASIESGKGNTRPTTARKIAEALGEPLEDIWAACPHSKHERTHGGAK